MICYEAVIFDLDGTLLDTLGDLAASTNRTLTHFGFPQRSLEEVRQFVGNGVEMLIHRAVPADTPEEAEAERQIWLRPGPRIRQRWMPPLKQPPGSCREDAFADHNKNRVIFS